MNSTRSAASLRFACLLVLLTFLMPPGQPSCVAQSSQTRPVSDPDQLKRWLQNMAWYHRYTAEEMQDVTGLSASELESRLRQFEISEHSRPARVNDRLLVLPYPGGRHPRIGFLEGAIDPLRETKLSVFCPWDDHSYAVLDVPEAIWSGLGLTWLAHTHIPTIWDQQGIKLPHQEWRQLEDGSFVLEYKLPNGIEFGTKVNALADHVRMKMWITNGTAETLTGLRVQNCVMLKAAEGFSQQTNDNKRFENGYAAAGSPDRTRWIITAWDPLHRAWGNTQCPCLHADPVFDDCPPGETRFLRGWFSFYQGTDIDAELARIESTGWRRHPLHHVTGNVTGSVRDAQSGRILPCRLYAQNIDSGEWHFAQSTAVAGSAVTYRKVPPGLRGQEQHTTLSADPFQLQLPPGRYRIRAEHGKEFLPAEQEITVDDTGAKAELRLTRFVDMAQRGWYSGDTHVHRPIEDLPNLMLAEDLNVALPLTYWVRDSDEIPAASGPPIDPVPIVIDAAHVIYPVNTEYEVFTVGKRRHTQGAVFVLNHQQPLRRTAPPVLPVVEEARRQGALLDLDKHSWNWSMMIVPLMQVDLFELSNNHHWRTEFGFPRWTLDVAPDWPEVERNEQGYTEWGWTEFGMQTYYSLLNCGFRMRVSGGTGSGVHPVPLGHGRVYVHVSGGNPAPADRPSDSSDSPVSTESTATARPLLQWEDWIASLNAGNSFVTTGPLTDLRFNGQLPGTTWGNAETGMQVAVTGQIHSAHPLKSLQLIHNGEIISLELPLTRQLASGAFQYDIRTDVAFENSGWVAVRCYEDLPDGKVSFAHTNPVFVDITGRPLQPRRRDAEYFVQRMKQEIERNTGVLSEECLDEYRRAQHIYQAILDRAVK